MNLKIEIKKQNKHSIITIKLNVFKKVIVVDNDIRDEFINEIKQSKTPEELRMVCSKFNIVLTEEEFDAFKLDDLIGAVTRGQIDDDTYQELFLKGFEILKQIKQKKIKIKNEQKWFYIHKSLVNKLTDRKIKSKVNFVDIADLKDSLASTQKSPEDIAIVSDLVEKIKSFALTQDEATKIFISEYFNPSKDIVSHLSSQNDKKTWKNRDFNPLYLANILTKLEKWDYKDPRTKWLTIKQKLKKFLLGGAL